MSEIADRVKAAIREAIWPNDYEGAFWQDELNQAARAAIGAMREPTSTMVRNGMISVETRRPEKGSSREQAEACWKSMIDSALAQSGD